MTEVTPGWYPNPDGSANERRWDGKKWTDETREYPPPVSGSTEKAIPVKEAALQNDVDRPDLFQRIPRWGWITIAGAIALILVLAAVVPAFNEGLASQEASNKKQVSHPLITPQPEVAPVQPTPAGPVLIPMGSPIVSPNFSMVIDSVEVLDQIETNYDGPIVADPGTKLVLVHSTITITGNAQDLTCGSDLFMQAYDSNKSEMAHVFEGPRIPGNPQCNYKTSAGQTVAWNFAFKMGADRSPFILSVIDTDVAGSWGEEQFASLQ